MTASVLLSIEIGADGKVGQRRRSRSRRAPTSTPRRSRPRKQFVFEPAEVDGKPAPVKIDYRYDFAIKTQMVKLGPQVNFEGACSSASPRSRCAGVTVTLDETGAVDAAPTPTGTSSSSTCRSGAHKVQLSGDKLVTVATEETIEKDQKKTVKYFVEAAAGGHRRGDGRARGAHQEGVGADGHPHRGGAARSRHAGRHAQGRAEPARRRALGVRLGRAHRLGLGAGRHARLRRRRRDPGALSRRRAALDDERRPGALDRSGARRLRRRVRPRPRRPGARRDARRCRKRACTATSPPTCSTPRRC